MSRQDDDKELLEKQKEKTKKLPKQPVPDQAALLAEVQAGAEVAGVLSAEAGGVSETQEQRPLTNRDQLFWDLKGVIGRGLVDVAKKYLQKIDKAGLKMEQGVLQVMLQERIDSARRSKPEHTVFGHIINEGETATQLIAFAKELGLEVVDPMALEPDKVPGIDYENYPHIQREEYQAAEKKSPAFVEGVGKYGGMFGNAAGYYPTSAEVIGFVQSSEQEGVDPNLLNRIVHNYVLTSAGGINGAKSRILDSEKRKRTFLPDYSGLKDSELELQKLMVFAKERSIHLE